MRLHDFKVSKHQKIQIKTKTSPSHVHSIVSLASPCNTSSFIVYNLWPRNDYNWWVNDIIQWIKTNVVTFVLVRWNSKQTSQQSLAWGCDYKRSTLHDWSSLYITDSKSTVLMISLRLHTVAQASIYSCSSHALLFGCFFLAKWCTLLKCKACKCRVLRNCLFLPNTDGRLFLVGWYKCTSEHNSNFPRLANYSFSQSLKNVFISSWMVDKTAAFAIFLELSFHENTLS